MFTSSSTSTRFLRFHAGLYDPSVSTLLHRDLLYEMPHTCIQSLFMLLVSEITHYTSYQTLSPGLIQKENTPKIG